MTWLDFRTLCNMFLSSIYVTRRDGSFLVKLSPIFYVIFTGCENIVEVFESLTICF